MNEVWKTNNGQELEKKREHSFFYFWESSLHQTNSNKCNFAGWLNYAYFIFCKNGQHMKMFMMIFLCPSQFKCLGFWFQPITNFITYTVTKKISSITYIINCMTIDQFYKDLKFWCNSGLISYTISRSFFKPYSLFFFTMLLRSTIFRWVLSWILCSISPREPRTWNKKRRKKLY